MPAPVVQRVSIVRVPAVCLAEGPGQSVGMTRNYDPVHMIRHKAVAQKPHVELLRAVLNQLQVNATIGVGEEDHLAVDTALRDLMRRLRQHHASDSSHLSE